MKLVTCIEGEVFDCVMDLRQASATYGSAISVTLVVTYTRLRRPHPVVVRIVVAAVVLLPFAFFLQDLAYAAFVAGR